MDDSFRQDCVGVSDVHDNWLCEVCSARIQEAVREHTKTGIRVSRIDSISLMFDMLPCHDSECLDVCMRNDECQGLSVAIDNMMERMFVSWDRHVAITDSWS